MGKMDWSQLRITEEWATNDPSDLNAIALEQERINTLATLVLKAFERHKVAQARRVKSTAADADQRMGE